MFRLFCFDVRDLFYTFSISKAPFRRGGGGPYPLQESPWSATSFSYQCSLRVFPRVQSRMHIQYGNPPWGCNVLYIAQVPSRLTVSTYFLASDFRRTRIPTTSLCEEVNGLEISIALERQKLQQLSGNFFFFFFTVYLQICLSDFLENSGKALIISKRLKSVFTEKSSKIGKSWPQLKT